MRWMKFRTNTSRTRTLQSSDVPTIQRGQGLVELALVLPLLVVLLSVVVEAGLAINAWVRVNTAARDATRFYMDAGRSDDTASLVLEKLAGIDLGATYEFTRSNNIEVFVIKATTTSTGTIGTWQFIHRYDGNHDNIPAEPKLRRSALQARLNSQGLSVSRNVTLYAVEVDYTYHPLLATILRDTTLPMTSYAVIQKDE